MASSAKLWTEDVTRDGTDGILASFWTKSRTRAARDLLLTEIKRARQTARSGKTRCHVVGVPEVIPCCVSQSPEETAVHRTAKHSIARTGSREVIRRILPQYAHCIGGLSSNSYATNRQNVGRYSGG